MCSVGVCDLPTKCRGMCKRHYEMWLSSADPSEKMTPKAAYNPDFIVEKYRAGQTLTEIAAHYDRTRRTLGDYIKVRPELYAEIQRIKAAKKFTPEEVVRRNREAPGQPRIPAREDRIAAPGCAPGGDRAAVALHPAAGVVLHGGRALV